MSDESVLRICYVVSYFHPFESGAERQALAQGCELVRRGHTVHVVTHAMPGYAADELVGGIRVHRWIRSSKTGPLFAPTFVASVVGALRRLRAEYDLIHTHQALWEAVATGVASTLLGGAPTLVQPASSGYYGEADELVRTKGASLLRRAILQNTAFAAISADIERQWLALGVPPGRMFRTASGVDAERFKPGASSVESALLPRPRVVFTGRLHPQKNLDLLLEAWPAVANMTAANLILVGQGVERERLERRAEELGVAGRVCFVGAVAQPEEYLRACDIFVLPSVAEGMSNSLLEAMATGLPCVVSGIGGNTDLVSDRQNGRTIHSNDPAEWSAALVELIGDAGLARRWGDASRARVEAEFALPVVLDRYVSLYRQLLSDWPG